MDRGQRRVGSCLDIVNNKSVPREENTLSITVQDPANKKKAGRWSPAVAGRGESSMPTAAKTAWK
jgi:hypothetical protein